MLKPKSVFVSGMLSPLERQQLRTAVSRVLDTRRFLLQQGIPAPIDRDTLFELLEHATARAKKGFYVATPARLDRKGLEWVPYQILSKRPRRKSGHAPLLRPDDAKPLQVRARENRPTSAGNGKVAGSRKKRRGRPANTAAPLLVRDVKRALCTLGLPVTGRSSILWATVSACAAVAKLRLPEELKHVRGAPLASRRDPCDPSRPCGP
jgi:hypothetical protein